MANPATLAILGGLSIGGAALGVYLGQSAVGEIDPAYFGTADASTFHADLVPYRAADASLTSLAAVQGEVPIRSCRGCRSYPEEYRPVPDPAIERAGAASSAPPVDAGTEAALAGQLEEAAPDPEREAIVRYATYPVQAVEQAPPVLAPQPAEESPVER